MIIASLLNNFIEFELALIVYLTLMSDRDLRYIMNHSDECNHAINPVNMCN